MHFRLLRHDATRSTSQAPCVAFFSGIHRKSQNWLLDVSDKKSLILRGRLKIAIVLLSDKQKQKWVNEEPHSPESVPQPPPRYLGSSTTTSASVIRPNSSPLSYYATVNPASPSSIDNSTFLPPISEEKDQPLWDLRVSPSPSPEYPTSPADISLYLPPRIPELYCPRFRHTLHVTSSGGSVGCHHSSLQPCNTWLHRATFQWWDVTFTYPPISDWS